MQRSVAERVREKIVDLLGPNVEEASLEVLGIDTRAGDLTEDLNSVVLAKLEDVSSQEMGSFCSFYKQRDDLQDLDRSALIRILMLPSEKSAADASDVKAVADEEEAEGEDNGKPYSFTSRTHFLPSSESYLGEICVRGSAWEGENDYASLLKNSATGQGQEEGKSGDNDSDSKADSSASGDAKGERGRERGRELDLDSGDPVCRALKAPPPAEKKTSLKTLKKGSGDSDSSEGGAKGGDGDAKTKGEDRDRDSKGDDDRITSGRAEDKSHGRQDEDRNRPTHRERKY